MFEELDLKIGDNRPPAVPNPNVQTQQNTVCIACATKGGFGCTYGKGCN